MAKTVIRYDLLVSCPGDVGSELPLIDKAVEEFNRLYSDALGIIVQTKHWSKSSYPQSGDRPQALLNEQFVKDCDAAVALFWTRFGTPTDKYGSGTEEEIEIMLDAGKQVFMYFSDKPIAPSEHNPTEYARVKEFQEKHKGDVLYGTYASDEEFYTKFFAHLSLHFLSEKRVAEVRAERKSELCLKGIDSRGRLSDVAHFQDMKVETGRSSEDDFNKIKELLEEAATIRLRKTNDPMNSFWPYLQQPVEMDQGMVDIIREVADGMKLELPDGFFCVGNLKKSTISNSIFGGTSYTGTDAEKRKYQLLCDIYKRIVDLSDWLAVERAFDGLKCVKLALSNIGTCVDEDIDVALHIPKDILITLNEFPELSLETMRYLSHDCDMHDLFEIHSTSEYGDYNSALTIHPQTPSYHPVPAFPGTEDYQSDYEDELCDIFCYDIYDNGENFVVKLKFDYLKHHTTVAFPAAVLLRAKPETIRYTITSKNSAEVISGHLLVE